MSEAGEEIVSDEELYAPAVEEEVSWDSDFEALSDEAIEKFARAQGWRPLSQYRGAPGGWQDSRAFLKVGQDRLPVLRDNNHRMTEKIVRLENELNGIRQRSDDQMAVLNELRERARTADERGYQRAKAEIEARQTHAVESGDAAAVRQTTEELVALETGRAEREPARTPSTDTRRAAPPPEPEEVAAFKRANPWFGPDRRLTNLMVVQDQANLDANPNMPLAERLDLSRSQIVRMAPECFPSERQEPTRRQPARPAQPSARPGARSAPASESGETIDSISDPVDRAEARKAFNRFKMVFGKGYTEAEYMKTYNDPHGEIDVGIRDKIDIARKKVP